MTLSRRKITPHLWYDKEAKEAAEFYCSIFPDSTMGFSNTLHDTPSGDCDVVSFELSGQPFMAISAGPLFKINPSVSFMVNFDPALVKNARQSLDAMWEKLSQGGTPLMPLDTYPFSKRYGWIQDRFGLTWQLILSNPDGDKRPFIVPSLMFVGGVFGIAAEASDFYLSVFKNTKKGTVVRYAKEAGPEIEGKVIFTDFMIGNQWFAAMDSPGDHKFAFNEAVSLMVPCDTQEEIDYFWRKLSAVPEAEQCGWLKDKYGLSWQVWPTVMGEMMRDGTRTQIDRVTQAFLPMKRFDIAALKKAYEGNHIDSTK